MGSYTGRAPYPGIPLNTYNLEKREIRRESEWYMFTEFFS